MDTKSNKSFGKRRSLRLKDFDYSQPHYTYHVVIGTREKRSPLLRDDENVIEVAEYILDNSIRKDLADTREEYQWADYLDPPLR